MYDRQPTWPGQFATAKIWQHSEAKCGCEALCAVLAAFGEVDVPGWRGPVTLVGWSGLGCLAADGFSGESVFPWDDLLGDSGLGCSMAGGFSKAMNSGCTGSAGLAGRSALGSREEDLSGWKSLAGLAADSGLGCSMGSGSFEKMTWPTWSRPADLGMSGWGCSMIPDPFEDLGSTGKRGRAGLAWSTESAGIVLFGCLIKTIQLVDVSFEEVDITGWRGLLDSAGGPGFNCLMGNGACGDAGFPG